MKEIKYCLQINFNQKLQVPHRIEVTLYGSILSYLRYKSVSLDIAGKI